ncbi:MAG: RHS repeat-associated protein [Myxococcota bacterium]
MPPSLLHSIPGGGGGTWHVFDNDGRHLRTADAITGVVLREFEYDDEGRLISIAQAGSNTTFDHNGTGVTVTSPAQYVTLLHIDPDTGFLQTVTYPDGGTYELTYDDDNSAGPGLLTKVTPPGVANSHSKVFEYDDLGRMVADRPALLADKTLHRMIEAPGVFEVEFRHGGDNGRITRYRTSWSECDPDCDNRACGPDGCGGTCGSGCSSGKGCLDGQCQGTGCDPTCGYGDTVRVCGDNGCGGSCGTCPAEESCLPSGACSDERLVRRMTTGPAGFHGISARPTSGLRIESRKHNGTTAIVTLGPHPEHGMDVPLVAFASATIPALDGTLKTVALARTMARAPVDGLPGAFQVALTVTLTAPSGCTPPGCVPERVVSISALPSGSVNGDGLSEIASTKVTLELPSGQQGVMELDGLGRVWRIHPVDSLLGLQALYTTQGRISEIAYVDLSAADPDTTKTRVTTYVYQASSETGVAEVVSVTGPDGETAFVHVDPTGQAVRLERPDGTTIELAYELSGSLKSLDVSSADSTGETHEWGHDEIGRTKTYNAPPVTLSNGELLEPGEVYEYNDFGEVKSVVTPAATIVVARDPSTGAPLNATWGVYSTVFETDYLRRLVAVWETGSDWRGIEFGFDGSLLRCVRWVDGEPEPNGADCGDADVGRGGLDFDYNEWLQLDTLTVRGDGGSKSLSYARDLDGNLLTAGPVTITPSPASGRTNQVTAAGIDEDFTYEPNYGTLDETDWSGNGIDARFDYTTDELGRIVAIDEVVDGETWRWTYAYDLAGRLEGALRCEPNSFGTWDDCETLSVLMAGGTTTGTAGWVFNRYAYDANGNTASTPLTEVRTPDGARAWESTVDAQDRLIVVSEEGGYDVDANFAQDDAGSRTLADEYFVRQLPGGGTQSVDAVIETEYDPRGGLRSADVHWDIGGDVHDGTVTYDLDPAGRRIGRVVSWSNPASDSVRWIYQDGLNAVAQLSANDELEWVYVYASRGHVPDAIVRLASQELDADPPGVYRLVTDHLGSVRLVVAPDGTVRQRRSYGPFGQLLVDEEYDALGDLVAGCDNPERLCRPDVAAIQPFGFAGGHYDRATGLTRFGARDYDPRRARWTAKDPIKFAGGDTNLYAYVGGDPVNGIDPSGLLVFAPAVPYVAPAAGALLRAAGALLLAEALTHDLPEFGLRDVSNLRDFEPPGSGPIGEFVSQVTQVAMLELLKSEFEQLLDLNFFNEADDADPCPKTGETPEEQEAGEYLTGKAPKQVEPGTKTLKGQFKNDQGRIERWEAHYDEHGRQIGRTDYNAGNKAQNIPDTHHHTYEYSPGRNGHETGKHLPGKYMP